MTPEEHLRAGDPDQALAALQEQVRADPSNAKLRIFLFQLLCILGDWKRAVAQLRLSAELDANATVMAQAYREAILCEVYREKVFKGEKDPLILGEPEAWLAQLIEAQKMLAQGHVAQATALREAAYEAAPTSAGTINGTAFDWIADADMRLGPVLEVILNGRYFWLPFAQIQSLEIDEPSDLRDTVWMAGTLTLANEGALAVLIPTRYPGSETAEAGAKLARMTNWQDLGGGAYIGFGQRLLTIGEQDFPLMDIRQLKIGAQDDPDG
ncbi:type VI secretion system accessory protein TagJ [Pseudophaeobacter arcticus]|jgi:type VI secretion system protein ImpE|uniref:type VI secretion system accessory protein TagJ n=1 Tax=Pseudophaeobacter arcticus TaxID=385492 RepID=UPI002491E82C|nr:type VI secretion system accessory protein TagJ [Pseudophaeobacter arcticus]